MTLSNKVGHRARLRERFMANPGALSEVQILELLLTYAIPRQDVAPLAQTLLQTFGSLEAVLRAPLDRLVDIPGVGKTSAVLLKLVAHLRSRPLQEPRPSDAQAQPALFEVEPEPGPLFRHAPPPPEPEMRTYANDEVANALTFIPQAAQFPTLAAFKDHLRDHLPYNAESTRQRRANYIVERFFPQERLEVPLTYYAAHCVQEDLKPALFYHILKAEPLAAKIAEDLVWPALPVGHVDRDTVRDFILHYLPEIRPSSQQNALRSLFYTYTLLSVGTADDTTLRFHVRTGTLTGFLYVLTAEFPAPGIYTFEALEQGPMRRWLLWHREWMRRQLYNLRNVGIIAKVSEIDTMRQFTLAYDALAALRYYFEQVDHENLVLREKRE